MATATGASLLLDQALEWEPTVLYVGAVAATAFLAGFGPALLATILGFLIIEFVFLPPEMTFEVQQLDDLHDLLVLLTFAGIAMGIAWLAEQLEHRRDAMERTARHTALLSEATRIVAEAQSYEQALRELPALLCRRVADYAITYAYDPDEEGSIRRMGIAHADPERERLVRRLLDQRVPTDDNRYGPAAVVASGEPELIEDSRDSILEEAAERDTEYLKLLRRLDPISSIIVPLRARGRTIGALAVATTARSDRRYDEKDLERILELGHRVAVALDNLRLLREARDATEAREQIMAVVAHDLRNPLSTMLAAADLLDRAGESELARRVGKSLEGASDRAMELVEDLVDVSRMEAGEYDVEPRAVPVGELLQDARETAETAAADGAVELAVEPVPPEAEVWADRERLHRVFSNLLENACRFSPEGGIVRIAADPEEAEVVFSVTDDGPGIPEESMPHLFEQFWQGEGGGGGAGLGLAIVKGIVEAHGGRAWAENRDDGGATLCFTLPRTPSEEGAETRASPTGGSRPDRGEERRQSM